jgi:two-component system sensor histidine kinase CpxA
MGIRALFWKIFLSFWLVQAVFIGAAAVLFRRTISETAPPGFSTLRNLAVFSERTAVDIYEKSGSEALEAYLADLQQTTGLHLSIVDYQGMPVSKTPLSEEEQLLAKQALDKEQPVRSIRTDKLLLAEPVSLPGGHVLIAVAQMPPREGLPGPPRGQPLRDLAFGVVISGVVCFGLARYLTAPIERLRVAAQQLSKGDFSARAGTGNERRGDEIAELVGDFDKMAAQLQRLLDAQKRLLSDVSHEFRSPLTRINLALEPIRKIEDDRAVKAIERVERETDRLDEMVRKLLTLSRLEAEGPLVEKADLRLGELLSEVVADTDFEAQSEQRRVVLKKVDYCHVFANVDLLRSALENIIRNAIRYTEPRTDVEVTLQYARENEASMATIKVRDHGPGVPPDALEALFRPFYRLDDSRERKTGGAGLGLAIAKQAVLLHRGTIRASNAVDGGLEIVVMVPASPTTQSLATQNVNS